MVKKGHLILWGKGHIRPLGGSWELQACQPDLGAGEDYGATHPECAHQACEVQPGDQAQPAWAH